MIGISRHYLMSLSLLACIAAPGAANAQAAISNIGSGPVEDRVTQLERISNAHSQLLTQLQQQLADNQTDIDKLRGQIQENQYQLSQVVERQKELLLKIDSMPAANETKTNPPSAQHTGELRTTSPAVQSNDANSDYNAAFALVQDKTRQDEAVAAFQNFIKKYPESTYQPNANYWLGQLNYNKGKQDDATFYFASVVKKYPKSPKAPDAMYKVGVIMQAKGDTEKAKAVYQQVIKDYPNSDIAKQAQKKLAAM